MSAPLGPDAGTAVEGGSTGRSPCARCPAALGRSCCEVGDAEGLATLTRADVERIQAHAHLGRGTFVEEEILDEAVARAYEQRRPAWRGYFRRGPVRLTLARVGGACVFLDRRSGCSLPATVRPTACRLYPFEPRDDGGWTLAVEREGSVDLARASGEPRCLAVEEAGGAAALLRAFGTTEAAVRELGDRLRAEVRAHGAGDHTDGRRRA